VAILKSSTATMARLSFYYTDRTLKPGQGCELAGG